MEPIPKRFYYKQNRHQQLRGFYYTAMYGNVSRAARQMGLSQPTVTLQVQSLERDLGIKLFIKQGNKLKLNEDGKVLFKLAAQHVEGLDNLYGSFFEAREKSRQGKLRICAGFISASYFIPNYLRKFIDLNPDVEIHLTSIGPEEERFTALREDRVDILCGAFAARPDEFRYVPVLNSEPVLITSLDHPLAKKKNVTIEDMIKYDILIPPAYASSLPVLNFIYENYNRLNNPSRKLHFELVGWAVIKRYVEMNMGISIISEIAIEPHDRLAVISMKEHIPKRSYGIMLRRNQYITKEMQAFLDIMNPEKA